MTKQKGDEKWERILEILRDLKGIKLLQQRNQLMQAKIEKLEKEHGLTIRGAPYIP